MTFPLVRYFDTRSLALFRISLALVLLVNVFVKFLHLNAFFLDSGIIPKNIAVQEVIFFLRKFLPHFWFSDSLGMSAVFVATLIIGILFLIGYKTKLSNTLLLILVFSANSRNPYIIDGGDLLLQLLLFWSLFLPTSDRFTINRKPNSPQFASPKYFTSVFLIYVLQICQIYWSAAFSKLGTEHWRSGAALESALSLRHLATPIGNWLAGFPILCTTLNFAVIILELFVPLFLLILSKSAQVRLYSVAAFTFFHILIGLVFKIPIFALTCILIWIPIIPSSFWKPETNTFKPSTHLRPETNRLTLAFLSACIVIIFLSDLSVYSFSKINLNANRWFKGGPLPLVQNWGMFTRFSPEENEDPVIKIQTKMGTSQVYDMPSDYLLWYYATVNIGDRELKSHSKSHNEVQESFLKYFCREWNRTQQKQFYAVRADFFWQNPKSGSEALLFTTSCLK